MAQELAPETFEHAAAALAEAAAAEIPVRIRGGGSKFGWAAPGAERQPGRELSTAGLDQILEHNVGDLTAVVQAGVPMARLRAALAAEGQMLAIDPALGNPDPRATIGGVIATADSGPLRHRYGAPRDLVLGMTVALSDGTVARSGGKVIKNVAGYDLAKLFTGSFGTLGLIVAVSLRLHPLPPETATALGAAADAAQLRTAAIRLAAAPLELEALDVAWRGGRGGLLACAAGPDARRRAGRVASLMREVGLENVDVVEEDEQLWARQRAGQRSRERALVRIAARPARLNEVLCAVEDAGGTLVGRAALGISYVEVEPEAVAALRAGLGREANTHATVLDAPADRLRDVDRWGSPSPGALVLMERIKQRFDPARACNPGVFVGGI